MQVKQGPPCTTRTESAGAGSTRLLSMGSGDEEIARRVLAAVLSRLEERDPGQRMDGLAGTHPPVASGGSGLAESQVAPTIVILALNDAGPHPHDAPMDGGGRGRASGRATHAAGRPAPHPALEKFRFTEAA